MNLLTPFQNNPSLWLHHFPQINVDANKYSRGHAMIIGGYPVTGAARLAAQAAARAGAGLTTVAAPQIAFQIYATALTSIMVKPFASMKDFSQLLNDKRISAFLIGPGSSVTPQTRAQTLALLATNQPVVIDADAITCFTDNPPALFKAITSSCVLTPHEGEFSRIFNAEGDRLERARAASKQSGAIIILKGSQTIIAAPDGKAIINLNAPPTLATAGSGDVLSGIVLGLLAQGMDAFMAAAAAVWMHSETANIFGRGLIAEDLPDLLPSIFTRLFLSDKPARE
jgi:ADP-dependent NAD(P)H-hydrate dehydratase / NAD(P)H-hydrate epimerase